MNCVKGVYWGWCECHDFWRVCSSIGVAVWIFMWMLGEGDDWLAMSYHFAGLVSKNKGS